MKSITMHRSLALFSLAACFWLTGCSGAKLPGVSGKVTMDGNPVDKATVVFNPIGESGRPAIGTTNSSGNYSLMFSSQTKGIKPGKYQVTIRTYSEPVDDGSGEMVGESRPETIPDAYNAKTTLEADVPADGGTFNFELKSSEGTVVQPKAAPPGR
jgi:hypothetical protein